MEKENNVLEDEQVLGGDIRLVGFSILDSDEMLVVKKIVGNYVRDFSDTLDDYKGLDVYLDEHEDDYTIELDLEFGDTLESVSVDHENVFVGLDNGLKEMEEVIV